MNTNDTKDEQPAPVAEPHKQQEPMAWIERDMQCDDYDPDSVTCQKPDIAADGWEWVPLYTSPQPRGEATLSKPVGVKPWVPLTEYDIDQIPYSCSHADSRLIAFAIEAKLRELNEHREKNA